MGYNTALMFYNDAANQWPEEIRRAVDSIKQSDKDFGYGKVISYDHSSWNQLVVVGHNTGHLISYAQDLDPFKTDDANLLNTMAEVLRNNGYKVTKNRSKK